MAGLKHVFEPHALSGKYPVYKPINSNSLSVCLGFAVKLFFMEWFVLSELPETIFETIEGAAIALPDTINDGEDVYYSGYVVNQDTPLFSEFGSFSASELLSIGVEISHDSAEIMSVMPPEAWEVVGYVTIENCTLVSATRLQNQ